MRCLRFDFDETVPAADENTPTGELGADLTNGYGGDGTGEEELAGSGVEFGDCISVCNGTGDAA